MGIFGIRTDMQKTAISETKMLLKYFSISLIIGLRGQYGIFS